jgi:solute carrier family 25 (mitochondrial S-adenosylmethionine transporter), member 26
MEMLTRTVRQEGTKALISGLGPRVVWISAGGAVFLGAYELAKEFLLALKGSTEHLKE